MSDDRLKEVDSMTCPACYGNIEFVMDIQNPQPVKKNNVVVCGHCATICKVGDSNLVRMTLEEMKALDNASRALIATIVLGVLKKKARENGTKGN